jgi:hypothetical protein
MSRLFRIALIFSALFFTETAFSRLVDHNTVRDVAAHFAMSRINSPTTGLKKKNLTIGKIEPVIEQNNGEILAYVAHVHPRGFLVLSSDTNLEPVVAYSFRFNWQTRQSDNLWQILEGDLQSRKTAIGSGSTDVEQKNTLKWDELLNADVSRPQMASSFQQWPAIGSTSTGGWIETVWHQAAPFNSFCPMDSASQQRNLVGCVATAMAQIINYHQYTGHFRLDENDRYASSFDAIQIDADSAKLDFPSFPKLNARLDQIDFKYKNNIQLSDSEKAALNFACAIVTRTNFAYPNSGAKIVNVAASFTDKLGYFSANVQFPDSLFYHILKANMMNGFPAQLSIHKSNAAFTSSHSVVADGYNTDGFFHLNFGWGENSPDAITDAWYLLPEKMGDGYNTVNSSIVDIKPIALPEPQLLAKSNFLDLPACRAGDTSNAKNVVLQNIGEESIEIDYIISSKNFFFSTPTTGYVDSIGSTTIPAGEKLILSVNCQPDTIGLFKGDIIVSYSTGRKYLTINLSGHGIPIDGTNVTSDSLYGAWDKAGSPYYITRSSLIPANQKLYIGPGTKVIFMGAYNFTIGQDAQLSVNGTESDSVHFSPFYAGNGWKGFTFTESGRDDSIAYCVVTGCKHGGRGGAISLIDSSPTISHSRISGNEASYGGAISMTASSPVFRNLKISGNRATNGGAISITASSPVISNLTISDNRADYGGAISFHRSSATITHTRMENNIGSKGGGALAFFDSSPVITNTILCNNLSEYGGALYGRGSSPKLINLTISKNEATEEGGALYLDRGNDFYFKNSILWHNKSDIGTVLAFSVPRSGWQPNFVHFNYCAVNTKLSNWRLVEKVANRNLMILWEHGNIFSDPLFSDGTNNDLSLGADSPCVDAGDPIDPVGDELFPHGYCVNMGAYGGTNKAIQTIFPRLTVAPNPIDFKSVPITDKKEITCYLKNGSPTTLNITEIILSDSLHFQIERYSNKSDMRYTLHSGDIDSIKIKYSPTQYSTKKIIEQLNIKIDGRNDKSVKIRGEVKFGFSVSGDVSGVWTTTTSPYNVTRDIEIPARKRLKIMPGVTVRFMDNYKLKVGEDAQLKAIGSPTDSIKFYCADTARGWGGLEINDSGDDDTLAYCVIRNANVLDSNSTRKEGGGLYLKNSSPLISHCSIIDNNAEIAGGIYFSNSNARIEHTRIEGNHSTVAASAIKLSESSPLITNTTICNNSTPGYCFMDVWDSSPTFVNVTASHNNTTKGVSIGFGSNVEFKNSILRGCENQKGGLIDVHENSTLKLSYSNIDTFVSRRIRSGATFDWGPDNIAKNPLFSDPENGDFTLLSKSPCIDAGDPDTLFCDPEDVANSGSALWPAMGTLRNDMGACGGGKYKIIPNNKNDQEPPKQPLTFSLKQNYPNPFNPTTTIEYVIPEPGQVQLSIYNMLGRRIKIVAHSQHETGLHRKIWNGRDKTNMPVAAGIYFCRMHANGFDKTMKLVLLQ